MKYEIKIGKYWLEVSDISYYLYTCEKRAVRNG